MVVRDPVSQVNENAAVGTQKKIANTKKKRLELNK